MIEHVPRGYEIYEHPVNAQVFLRKKRPKIITDIEKHLVEKYVSQLSRSKRYRVDCKDDCITIYESDADFGELEGVLGDFLKKMPLRSDIKKLIETYLKLLGTDQLFEPLY